MTGAMITTSDDVRLYVETLGEGRPIVFIAGYTASIASWGLQLGAVTAAGCRAICYDRRFHGRSDRPGHGQRISRHAADLHEVINALGLEKPFLVGGSMGASVCWSYLDLFGPSNVAGVVSVDQTPRMVNGDGWDLGFYGLTEDNLGQFFENGVPPTGRGMASPRRDAGLAALAAMSEGVAIADPITRDSLPLLNDHARQDWRDVCARTSTPQLFIAGRGSQLWPWQHAREAASGNSAARHGIVEECGHAVNIEQPQAFNALLLDFVADAGKAGS